MGKCSQEGMEKGIEASGCVELWDDRGHGQENEYENSGVVPQGVRLLHARLRGSKFHLSSVERGSGSDMT
jgi:hypothetical protein